MQLLDLAISEAALSNAWSRVRSNGGAEGADGITLERFEDGLFHRLAKLRQQVRDGTYNADPLLRIELPRANKAPRLLAVPSVRDRILQTAVTQVLVPLLDPQFEEESYAYRPGRGVQDAVRAVIDARENGMQYVVDADIEAFFDTIPHDELLARLLDALPDASLQPLINKWLTTPIKTSDGFVRPQMGVAQGSPLSPLLANLYLDKFDETLVSHENCRLVRYADDFIIAAPSHDAAELALETAALWLGAYGLQVNFDKTRIVTFTQGFTFLGVRFEADKQYCEDPNTEVWLLPPELRNRRLAANPGIKPRKTPSNAKPKPAAIRPPSQTPPKLHPEDFALDHDVAFEDAPAPLLRTIYLNEPGSYIRLDGGRIKVQRNDEELLSVPIEKVDQILVGDEGAISFAVLRTLASRGASLVLQSKTGEPLSALLPLVDTRASLRAAQHKRLADASFTLHIARSIVAAKIANSRLLLRRYYRFRPGGESGADTEMQRLQLQAPHAADLDTLRGFEGAAAKAYFAAWRGLLPAQWQSHFGPRSRQPPRDAVNALLSYGYAVLYQNTLTLAAARGLDVHYGHLHAVRDGHPSLVSDLVEEFRALVVDTVVLKLAQDRAYEPSAFEQGQGGAVYISRSWRRMLIERLENKLQSEISHPITGEKGDYRRMIRMQIGHYVQHLLAEVPNYRPFTPR